MDSRGSFILQHMFATENMLQASCTSTIMSFKSHTTARSKLITRTYILYFTLHFLVTCRCGRDLPHPSDEPWGPSSLLYNGYRVSLQEVKRPGRRGDQPPTFTAEVKAGVQPHLYSTSYFYLLSYNIYVNHDITTCNYKLERGVKKHG